MVLPLIIAIIAIFVVVLLLIKVEHHFRKYKMVVISLVILLLVVSVVYVFATNNIDYGSYSGLFKGIALYFGWIIQTTKSIWGNGVEITGKVISAFGFGK